MKKALSVILTAVMTLGIAGCTPGSQTATKSTDSTKVTNISNTANASSQGAEKSPGAKFKEGTYEFEVKGHNGPIKAKVTLDEEKISAIEVLSHKETEGLGDMALEKVRDSILSSQSLSVDTISGATVSSQAMISLVSEAVTAAGGDLEAFKQAQGKKEDIKSENLSVDVAIIGAGGAGMSAAVEASLAGKKVVVLEKMPIVGGNTSRATGGMNAAETKIQAKLGIQDSKKTFYDDTFQGGKNENDPALLKELVEKSSDAIDWVNGLGAGLTRVSLSGGATNPRIHTPEDGSAVGPVLVKVLSKKLEELKVPVMTETKAIDLIEKDNRCVGVVCENKEGEPFNIQAKAVVLATGGFSANAKMVESFRPDLVGFSTTNQKGATGDGLKLAEDLDSQLDDIKFIQIHPTTDPETGYLFTEGLRGDGAILLNSQGKRFIDELKTRDVVSSEILKQTGKVAWVICNEEMRKENAALAGYVTKGYAKSCPNLKDVATTIGASPEEVEKTMASYKEAVKTGKDSAFQRKHMSKSLEQGPYYVLKVTPGIHHTMGGLKIDTQTHVLNKDGKIIPGLYAAGEITGGVHGANRIGGNAVTDVVVFGRIAGQTAAKELK